jgi:phospholipid transport system substrate-binding protein
MPFTRRGALVWLVALALAVPAVARADTAGDAGQFVDRLVNSALHTLAQTKGNEAQREQDFNKLLGDNFDIPRIARFVLGRHWTTASDPDRQRFIAVYRDFIIKSYAAQFANYSGETVKVTGARPESADVTVVNSEIIHPDGGEPAKVAWRVRHESDGSYKIVDVDVEGVSMLLAQREEFSSVIQRSGGSVNGLITAIQQKLQNNDLSAHGG